MNKFETPCTQTIVSKFMARIGKTAFIYPVGSTVVGIEFSPKLYVFNVLMVTLLVIIGFWSLLGELNLYRIDQSVHFPSAAIAVTACVQYTLCAVFSLEAVIRSAARYTTLLDIEQVLDRVDRALDSTAASRRVEWCAFWFVVTNVVAYAFNCYTWLSIGSNKSYFFVYTIHYITLVSIVMYAQIAWCIGHRFDTINREMEDKLKLLTAPNCTEFVTRKYQSLSDLVLCSNACRIEIKYIPFPKFQELYWSLCNSVNTINEQYGLQLMIGLLLNVMDLVNTPKTLIVKILNPERFGPLTIDLIINITLWLSSHLCYLFLMVLPASFATSKAEKTACIVCEHLNINLAKDDIAQLELFILQLQKFKIQFSICGVITLQRSTITKVIGTVITYLVISIPFLKSS